jgi:hypothetical protein
MLDFEHMEKLVIAGDFYEGKRVTVKVDGKVYTRKVMYKKSDGLYITINNYRFFEYEFKYM